MQQPPVEFPAVAPSHTFSGRTSTSRTYQIDELDSPSAGQKARFFTLRTSLALVALACLGLYIAARLPQWDSLFARQAAAPDVGDPVLAEILQWIPLLLIMVSSAVLALMAVLSLRERRAPSHSRSLELVPPTAQGNTQPSAAAVAANSSRTPAPTAPRPFLVGRSEHRFHAREEIRLNRDARIAAAHRSEAVSRLRIKAAAPHAPQPPPSAPDPVLRPSVARRKDLLRDKVPASITATLNRQMAVAPNSLPPATA